MQRRCLLDMERIREHGQSELRAGPTVFGAIGVQAIGLGLRRLGSHLRWPEEGQMSVAECSRLFSPSRLSDAEGSGAPRVPGFRPTWGQPRVPWIHWHSF